MTTSNISSWNDFNDADTQSGFDLIPKGTLVPVRMTIKPGGYRRFRRKAGRGGYATAVLRDWRGLPRCRVRGHRRRLRQTQAVEQHRPVLGQGPDLGPDGPQLHPRRAQQRPQRPPAGQLAAGGRRAPHRRASTSSMASSSSPASTSRRTPRAATATWSRSRSNPTTPTTPLDGRAARRPRRTRPAPTAQRARTGVSGTGCATRTRDGQTGVGAAEEADEMLGLQTTGTRVRPCTDTRFKPTDPRHHVLGLGVLLAPLPGRLSRAVRQLEARARTGIDRIPETAMIDAV
jgi:hypothetical protein